jgi:hypothetical protein
MILSFRIWRVMAAVCLLAICSQAQEQGMEMSGFRAPEYDDQGNMIAQLFGGHAEVGLSGEVKIDQLRLEFYQAGEKFVTVESPFCIYNSQKREAYSVAEVSATAEKIKVKGRGFDWNPAQHSIRIFNDVHVVMENAGGLKNSLLSGDLTNSVLPESGPVTGGVVTVTSKEMFLDYTARTVQFEKEVHVQSDDGTEMRCEILKIPLGDGHSDKYLPIPGMTKPVIE